MGRFREIQGDAGEIWGRLLAQCLGEGRGWVGERGTDLVEGAEALAQRARRSLGQPRQQLAHLEM